MHFQNKPRNVDFDHDLKTAIERSKDDYKQWTKEEEAMRKAIAHSKDDYELRTKEEEAIRKAIELSKIDEKIRLQKKKIIKYYQGKTTKPTTVDDSASDLLQKKIFQNVYKYYAEMYSNHIHEDHCINMCAFWVLYKLLKGMGITLTFGDIIKMIDAITKKHPSDCRRIGEEQTEDFLSHMMVYHKIRIFKRMELCKNIPEYMSELTTDRWIGLGVVVSDFEVVHSISCGDDGTCYGHYMLKKK